MWIVRKKHECLSAKEKEALEFMYLHSPLLKQVHKTAVKLTHIFNSNYNRKSALTEINRWIANVQNTNLTCFDRFINTLNKYKVNILNYLKSRKNSGFVEGLNNKIKLLKRRCYGMSKPASLFQRLFLDLRGYKLFSNYGRADNF